MARNNRHPQLRKDLSMTVQELRESGFDADVKVSVYDLESHSYTNVNGNNRGWAASIIKVPIMIAALTEIESGNLKLETLLQADHSLTLETYDPVSRMKDGDDVMVYDLIRHMISSSDNEATNIIAREIGIPKLNRYFIINADSTQPSLEVTSLFCLYNSVNSSSWFVDSTISLFIIALFGFTLSSS